MSVLGSDVPRIRTHADDDELWRKLACEWERLAYPMHIVVFPETECVTCRARMRRRYDEILRSFGNSSTLMLSPIPVRS
jgi:hypothetical protein